MAEGTGDSLKRSRLGSPGQSVEDYFAFVHFIQRYEINQIRRSEMKLCVVVHYLSQHLETEAERSLSVSSRPA